MKKLIILLFNFFNCVIPKNKKQILFFSAYDYEDNARAIYEYLIKEQKDNYSYVWIINNEENRDRIKGKAKIYLYHTLPALIAYYRSGLIIRTHSLYGNNYCKKSQKMFVVWHGMPLKGLNIQEEGNNKEVNCTLFTSTSEMFIEPISTSFKISKECIEPIGLPRNDFLFETTNVMEDMHLNMYKKTIIWMPTFRKSKFGISEGKSYAYGVPFINEDNINVIDKVLKDNSTLLILKLHPWEAKKVKLPCGLQNIILINNNDIPKNYTLYNLIGCCDALITDYSSVYFDYLLLNRPICFAYDDFKEYTKNRRMNFQDINLMMPGYHAKNYEELRAFLQNINYKDSIYKVKRENARREFHKFLDGNSCKRLSEYIIKSTNA